MFRANPGCWSDTMFCGVLIAFCIWYVHSLWPKWWHRLSVRNVSSKSSMLKWHQVLWCAHCVLHLTCTVYSLCGCNNFRPPATGICCQIPHQPRHRADSSRLHCKVGETRLHMVGHGCTIYVADFLHYWVGGLSRLTLCKVDSKWCALWENHDKVLFLTSRWMGVPMRWVDFTRAGLT